MGLSPRVRGNQIHRCANARHEGPIPACAGQPWRPVAGTSSSRAYPRVCGATQVRAAKRASDEGLSPRVRGNLRVGHHRSRILGPIPACAGQPLGAFFNQDELMAYPRVCGATPRRYRPGPAPWGLSPRVRGNLCSCARSACHLGPIPACAGQPIWSSMPASAVWAYPRVCGATLRLKREGAIRQGLSPRVRGNLVAGVKWRDFVGPIPACAGQPGQQESCAGNHRAYPRVCGATGTWTAIGPASRGLSPRVRGNPRQHAARSRSLGPIPACAGQP